MSFQSRSHASCWNSTMYAEVGRDRCCNVRIFFVAIKVWSLSPNVLLNSSKNWSRSARSGESFSNSDKNQDNAVPVSSDPMSPTCVSSVAYQCGWKRKTNRTWLAKSRSFVRSLSNFSGKLVELDLLRELEHGLEHEQLGTVPWRFVGWHSLVVTVAAWQPRRAFGCWKRHPSW